MRYIGGKRLLLDKIQNVIDENTENVNIFADFFSGSGVVSSAFSNRYKVLSNDFMYFSYVISRGKVNVKYEKLRNLLNIHPIEYLNNLKWEDTDIPLKKCFIYQNYSKHDDCERMYFTAENALKIDVIRIVIERWKEQALIDQDEYFALLSALIEAVPYVSNITGTYGAYLKHWDKRSLQNLTLEKKKSSDSLACDAYNLECLDFAKEIFYKKVDVAYLDPPYNQRQYLPNYHILETIAMYDYPRIKGVTGMRNYAQQKSLFSQKKYVRFAFRTLLEQINARYIVISYNNEGLITTEELSNLMREIGIPETFRLYEFDYRRYKSKIPNNENGLKEQIYFVEKKTRANIFFKSPMNYIGGKYKLLPQLTKFFPHNIDTFVDIFAGGLNVAINTHARRIICNDINNYVIDIYKLFQDMELNQLLQKIDNIIEQNDLSMYNKEAYLNFRQHYNSFRDPLDLFVLVCYSFNYQFRFNSAHEYNNPFGKARSCYNKAIKGNLIDFHRLIREFEFQSLNFKNFDYKVLKKGDFIYADPPYLITCGSYNDGRRGFEGWGSEEELALYDILDYLNKRQVLFALSNVIEHKGKRNELLIKWSDKYNVHYLNNNYNNSNYQSKNRNNVTREVLITNY